FNRWPLSGLGDRYSAAGLAVFLGNPQARYPDGRMPRLPVPPETARDIAAYLLLWSKPAVGQTADASAPSADEVNALGRRLGGPGKVPVAVRGTAAADRAPRLRPLPPARQ